MLDYNFDALFDDEASERERQEKIQRKAFLYKLWHDPNTNPAILNILRCAKFLKFTDMVSLFFVIDSIENDRQFKEYSDKCKRFDFEALQKAYEEGKQNFGIDVANEIYKNTHSEVQLQHMSLTLQQRREWFYEFIIERSDLAKHIEKYAKSLINMLTSRLVANSHHKLETLTELETNKLRSAILKLLDKVFPADRDRTNQYVTYLLSKARDFFDKMRVVDKLDLVHRCSPKVFSNMLNEFDPDADFLVMNRTLLHQMPIKREERSDERDDQISTSKKHKETP